MTTKKNIAIIFGGDSSEIVVSKKSMLGVYSFIDDTRYNRYPIFITKEGWFLTLNDEEIPVDKNDFSVQYNKEKIKFDFAYITIHGTPGEDGLLQGYFDMLDVPYSCCGVLAAAITFNKFTCNTYLKGFGVKVADSVMLRKGISFNPNDIIEKLGLPCFVKPNLGGSSFGVSKVKTAQELMPAIEKAFNESKEVIIEQLLVGTEVTCGLYKINGKETVFPLTEVISKNEFFDFEAKYNADKAEEITPARLSPETTEKVQKISSAIYDIINCKGIVRMDYIITAEAIFLLEVNTTPGMTMTSFIPQQVKAAGLDIKKIFTEIIESNL